MSATGFAYSVSTLDSVVVSHSFLAHRSRVLSPPFVAVFKLTSVHHSIFTLVKMHACYIVEVGNKLPSIRNLNGRV